MTKLADDNTPYKRLVAQAEGAVPNAEPGGYNLFIDSADGLLKKKDDAGVVTTIGSASEVSDVAYDAATWEGVVDVAPSKNAVRDKFESLPSVESGGGNIFLWAWDIIASVGTWVLTGNASQYFGLYQRNSSSAQNDYLEWSVFLPAGTYTIKGLFVTSSDGGIATFKLDGVSIGTIDLYSGGTAFSSFLSLTSVVIATGGLKTLRVIAETKNASSSGYTLFITYLSIWRTA